MSSLGYWALNKMEMEKISREKVYAFDLDGTLTEDKYFEKFTDENFYNVTPNLEIIDKLKKLYNSGCMIIIHTARPDLFLKTTQKWLKEHNIPHHHLVMGKCFADVYVDDRSVHPKDLEV